MSLQAREVFFGYSGAWSSGPVELNSADETVLFIIGPNGSGKSTLIKTLVGVLSPVAGEVCIDNLNISQIIQVSRRPAYMPSSIHFQWGLCGHDLLALYEAPKSKWFDENIFEKWNLAPLLSASLDSISSGERQKIVLAATLCHPNDVVVLDEPLSFLDWPSSQFLAEIIRGQIKRGRRFIIANHDLQWLLNFSQSTTLLLDKRRVAARGATSEVLTSKTMAEVFTFRAALTDNPLDGSQLLALAKYEQTTK